MKLEKLLEDENFVKQLKESTKIILKDNKINEYDIPEIIFILTNIIDKEPKIKLNSNNLGSLVKELFDYILKNNINQEEMTQEQKENLDKLITSSIKLVLMKPNYSKLNKLINRILYCK